jgi:hypothetical protein
MFLFHAIAYNRNMPKRGEITDIVDGLLKFSLSSGTITLGLVAPGSLHALERPLQNYFKRIDERKREREFQRALRYMKNKGLVKGSYEHGLQITEKGRERLEKTKIDNLKINKPEKWDKRWRIILFDIPEPKKQSRDALSSKLKDIGFSLLQKSVWVYPFECRQEVEQLSVVLEVDKFVTYIETSYIDKQALLERKFNL